MSENEHQIFINHLILHILDTNVGAPVLSAKELEAGEEGFGFVEKIVEKLLADDNLKDASFVGEANPVRERCIGLMEGREDFVEVSRTMANMLYEIMSHYPSIPPADLVCCQTAIDGRPYLVLLKLNYKTGYIHFVQYDGDTQMNTIVKQKTVLPSESQRVDEGVLIDLEELRIRLVEKGYELDGEKGFYLSQKLLACRDQLSTAEKAKIISKAVETVGKKFGAEAFDTVARLRKTVVENIHDETATVDIEGVAKEIFSGQPAAQQEYIEEVRKAGVSETEVRLSEKIAERKFSNHKIKTDTGIEILFPATYFNNNEMIEFVNNPNGTISIVIKNVGKITNK
ncbi:MAG TPA: nucleoid-associated protein [Bacillota bacterium]|nr:nucleoid-associated protein [Bacillota bacterium]